MFARCVIPLLAAAAAAFCANSPLRADEAEGDAGRFSFTPPPEFQEFVTAIAREHLPDEYEKTKNWGHTKRVWAGVKVERDGLRVETRRRYRQVNDGAWQRYRIDLIQPEKHFQITVANIRQSENKILAEITAVAKLHAFGRHSQWERGVQLFSISADATARVRLKADVEITTRLDATKIPPDLLLSPRVTSADLEILDFRLDRVSDLDGPLVKSLSSTVREILEDKLAEKRQKLVEKMNKSLAKREEKFRLSAKDAIGGPLPLMDPLKHQARPATE
ncbi:MAG TPA: hypothetical protein VMP01_16445 [Pirellulaceae bacterium]|nr:hypothetical protein [Pirellulaceae bacterium]